MRLTLTRQAGYALRAMTWLAHESSAAKPLVGRTQRAKAAEIASGAGVPAPFTARLLGRLQRSGLLTSRPGHDGGFALARPPREITLLQVVEAIEGPLTVQECLLRDVICGVDGLCTLHFAWSAAYGHFREALAEARLGDSVSETTAAGPMPVV